MHLPSTSVIPIHVPGDESAHIAYFIVLDGEGNPISQTSPELNNSLNDRLSIPNGNMDSALLNKMNSNMTAAAIVAAKERYFTRLEKSVTLFSSVAIIF